MRERLVICILGAKGYGKTTLLKALVRAAQRRGEKVDGLEVNGKLPGFQLAVDDEYVEEWLARRLPTMDRNDNVLRPAERKVDVLVFDDVDRYIPKVPKKGSRWRQLATTNRHADVDVILTGRRLQALPDQLISAIDYLYLFALPAADVNGIERLAIVAPGVELPEEKYQFVVIEPQTREEPRRGRTFGNGTYEVSP